MLLRVLIGVCCLALAAWLRWHGPPELCGVITWSLYGERPWADFAGQFAQLLLYGALPDALACLGVWCLVCGERASRRLPSPPPWAWALGACLASGVLRQLALKNQTLISDEFGYRFQAQIFEMGRWVAPLPPCPSSFSQANLVQSPSGWSSQYGPGWPMLLAGGWLFGCEQWMPALLTGGVVWMAQRVTRLLADRQSASCCGWLCFTFCGLLFNGATMFNHGPTLLCALAVWWAVLTDRPWLAGAAFGCMLDTRYPEALVFLLWLALSRRAVWRASFAPRALSAALLTALPFWLQNLALSGHPLVTGYMLGHNEISEPLRQKLQMGALALARLLGWMPAALWWLPRFSDPKPKPKPKPKPNPEGLRAEERRWLLLLLLHGAVFARPGFGEFGTRYMLLPIVFALPLAAARLSAAGWWRRLPVALLTAYLALAVVPPLAGRAAIAYSAEATLRGWFDRDLGPDTLVFLRKDVTTEHFYGDVRNRPDLSGVVIALFLEPEQNEQLRRALSGRRSLIVDWDDTAHTFVAQPYEQPRFIDEDLLCAGANLANCFDHLRERAVDVWERIPADSPVRRAAVQNQVVVLRKLGRGDEADARLRQLSPDPGRPSAPWLRI